ncbi:hypothetical protein AB0M86_29620 [Streptomyces sp. NPDC051639]|uniref:hypothetical protein n=1 Tax=Streptomyces sp. NPDC051639 TaxID=3155671 RepID=UPI00341DC862
MTTAAPPVSDPDPSTMHCAGSQIGLCAGCQRQTWRYGPGGLPLCTWCMTEQQARWGSMVRFKSTRP